MRRCRSTIKLPLFKDNDPIRRCELLEGHASGRLGQIELEHLYHVYANVVIRWVGAGRRIESRIRWTPA